MEVGQQVAALQQLKQTLLVDTDKSKSEGLNHYNASNFLT
jgi:hypothetical protein